MIKNGSVVLADDEAIPTVYWRIIKESGKFVYGVSLHVIHDGKIIELARFDNSHEEGKHHHHKFYKNSPERIEPLEFQSIGKIVTYLEENWRQKLEQYKK